MTRIETFIEGKHDSYEPAMRRKTFSSGNVANLLEEFAELEAVRFGNWLHIHSKEATDTLAPCRYYKNRLLSIPELYEIFTKESR